MVSSNLFMKNGALKFVAGVGSCHLGWLMGAQVSCVHGVVVGLHKLVRTHERVGFENAEGELLTQASRRLERLLEALRSLANPDVHLLTGSQSAQLWLELDL